VDKKIHHIQATPMVLMLRDTHNLKDGDIV